MHASFHAGPLELSKASMSNASMSNASMSNASMSNASMSIASSRAGPIELSKARLELQGTRRARVLEALSRVVGTGQAKVRTP